MRKIRAALIAGALTVSVLAIAPAASGVSATNVHCVGDPPCFDTVQKAVDAGHDGGVILIEPGTFAGGVTIDKSVKVIGSGASRTIIKGGGPVLTIGEAFAPRQPKVTISKVKITGGHRREREHDGVIAADIQGDAPRHLHETVLGALRGGDEAARRNEGMAGKDGEKCRIAHGLSALLAVSG